MKKSYIYVLSGIVILLLAGLAGYSYLVSPTKAPSQPAQGMQGNRPAMKPLAAAATTTAEEITPEKNQTRYAIINDESTATFTLNEMLRGEPKTVVGTSTGYIAGEFAINFAQPASSTIGEIRINARTFVTDDNSRNNMVRRAILKTEDDANEFITFKPTSMTLSPNQKDTSKSFEADIVGDLTIAGITKPATFHATVDIIATRGEINAHATTTVKRSDFNLVIPNIPFIANVDEDVKLELNIVANQPDAQ